MDYTRIHNFIINRAKTRTLNEYKELHHIVPRCMGGLDSLENLVALTAKEHWLIHLLLLKMYPDAIKLKLAMGCLTWKSKTNVGREAKSGKSFQEIRIAAVKAMLSLRSSNESWKKHVGEASQKRMRGEGNHMKRADQRERLRKNNPMYSDHVKQKFLGSKNPRAKKIKDTASGKEYETINECVEDLKITRAMYYYIVKTDKNRFT